MLVAVSLVNEVSWLYNIYHIIKCILLITFSVSALITVYRSGVPDGQAGGRGSTSEGQQRQNQNQTLYQ